MKYLLSVACLLLFACSNSTEPEPQKTVLFVDISSSDPEVTTAYAWFQHLDSGWSFTPTNWSNCQLPIQDTAAQYWNEFPAGKWGMWLQPSICDEHDISDYEFVYDTIDVIEGEYNHYELIFTPVLK